MLITARAVLVHTPISLLHAWSAFLLIEGAFEAFGTLKYDTGLPGGPYSPWTRVYYILSIVILELLAVGYAFWIPEGDFVAGLTVPWTLYGVQWSTFVPCFAPNSFVRD